MPPSGYNISQSNYVESFLRSCGKALLEEAKRDGFSIPERLAAEVADIDLYLDRSSDLDDVKIPVLNLTKKFYEMMQEFRPISDDDFLLAVDSVLKKIRRSVIEIKIDESFKTRERSLV